MAADLPGIRDYVIPGDGNEVVQETAYAILALNEVDRAGYIANIHGAATYLKNVQLLTGGWENAAGDGENNEVTAEALWGIHAAFPDIINIGETGTGPGGIGTNDGNSTLELWLDAGKGTTLTGSGVSVWGDQSGNNNDATQGIDNNRPGNPAAVVNSQPVVRFDGNSDQLSLPNFAASFSAGDIFIVI